MESVVKNRYNVDKRNMHMHQCRSCGANDNLIVLDLGTQPLANNLLRPEDLTKPEPLFPLKVFLCRQCWLLQITDLVPPVQLFSEYLYFSSFSETLLSHAKHAAERYIREFGLSEQSRVVEIASNDGYLLKNFVAAKIPCLGIEPASNIARVAVQNGIPTLNKFFSKSLGSELSSRGDSADLILANNVFAHVPDINDFTHGLKLLLKPKGTIVLEFPYAVDMIDHNEFDTIYHEHVYYYTVTALLPLFRRHDLAIRHIERLPIHGGSLRVFLGHAGVTKSDESVESLVASEQTIGVKSIGYYEKFGQNVEKIRIDLCELLQNLKSSGKRIAAYGASAKGSTLLNYFRLGRKEIDFVVDRSTYKQGMLAPGTHIPIVSPEKLMTEMPDYTVLLTWNFAEEILRQQIGYRNQGGKFIIPIPEVTIK